MNTPRPESERETQPESELVPVGAVSDVQGQLTERELLRQYLEVCNKALEKNRARFPFQQIFSQAQKNQTDRVTITLIDDCPAASFSFRFGADKKCALAPASDPRAADAYPAPVWRIRKSYILQVLADPAPYIDNPAMIDWEWLIYAPQP